MHELSVVAALIELCEDNARAQNAAQISEIHTKIGVLSGIDKEQFKLCFESFKSGTKCENATLFMQDESLKGECACGFSGELDGRSFFCPKCRGNDLKITAGEEFYLMKLVME